MSQLSAVRQHSSAGSAEHVIALRLESASELFDALDPAPLLERDLDPRAEEFIVVSARERPANIPLRLVVRVEGSAASPDEATLLRSAIQHHFARSAQAERRSLRELFKIGRISLVIGLGVLASAFGAGELVTSLSNNQLSRIVAESLVIGGWVAMWRPLEIFLYEWWPIGARARLYDLLSAVGVEIVYAGIGGSPASAAREMPAMVRNSGRRNGDRLSRNGGPFASEARATVPEREGVEQHTPWATFRRAAANQRIVRRTIGGGVQRS
jgi:hypothetical protein